jgi:hypothetical protein
MLPIDFLVAEAADSSGITEARLPASWPSCLIVSSGSTPFSSASRASGRKVVSANACTKSRTVATMGSSSKSIGI